MNNDEDKNGGGAVSKDPELPQEFRDARSNFYYRGSELDLAVYQNREDRDFNLDEFIKSFHYMVKLVQPMKDIDQTDKQSLKDLEQFIKDYLNQYSRDPGQGHTRLLEGYRFFSHILEKYNLNFQHTRKLCV